METISKSDCTPIGFIRKTHGVHGEIVMEFTPEFEESIAESSRFFIEIDGLLVPFFLKQNGLRIRSTRSAHLSLQWVDTKKYAKRLVGCSVSLYSKEINLPNNDYLGHKLENFILLNQQEKKIGKITKVDNYAGNIVFTVFYNGEDKLVPYHDELLINIDEEKKTITLKLPHGLFD